MGFLQAFELVKHSCTSRKRVYSLAWILCLSFASFAYSQELDNKPLPKLDEVMVAPIEDPRTSTVARGLASLPAPFSAIAVNCRSSLLEGKLFSDTNGFGPNGSFVLPSPRENGSVQLILFQNSRISAVDLVLPFGKRGRIKVTEDPDIVIDRFFDFQQILGFTFLTAALPTETAEEGFEILESKKYSQDNKLAQAAARRYFGAIFELSPVLVKLANLAAEPPAKGVNVHRDLTSSDKSILKALESCSHSVLWGYRPNPVAPLLQYLNDPHEVDKKEKQN